MALPTADAGGPYATLAYGSTSQALTGAGTPGTGGSSIVGWAWTIIDQPTGASATLSSATVQNPTLTSMSLPGTYRCKLVVTDNVGGVSVSSTLTAPDEAFADVCITTEILELEIPAASERNWKDKLAPWALALDGIGTEPATTTSLGTVELSESPVDAAAPVAVTQDRFRTSAYVAGKVAVSPSSGNPAQSLCSFHAMEDCNAVQAAVVFKDGGTTGRTAYTIRIYHQTPSEFAANTFATLLATITLNAPGTANIPQTGLSAAFDQVCSDRDLITFKVFAADADTADQGSDICLSVLWKRKW